MFLDGPWPQKENPQLIEDGEALSGAQHPIVQMMEASQRRPDQAGVLPKWFAVYTTPRHEKAVHRHLGLRDIESFLPLYRTLHRWKNGCKVAVEQPLFPSYLFVNIGRLQQVSVLQVPGVLWLVGAGREPSPLPAGEIESLRSELPQRTFEPYPYLVLGEKVRIISGPLCDMAGILVRKKNAFRVVLTLELIRQSFAVEVGVDEVEPLRS